VVDATMVAGPDWLRKQLEKASPDLLSEPDLLREMVATFRRGGGKPAPARGPQC